MIVGEVYLFFENTFLVLKIFFSIFLQQKPESHLFLDDLFWVFSRFVFSFIII